jgi:hypothetical protein
MAFLRSKSQIILRYCHPDEYQDLPLVDPDKFGMTIFDQCVVDQRIAIFLINPEI